MIAVVLIVLMVVACVAYEFCLGALSRCRPEAGDEVVTAEGRDAPPAG
ncbi:hypothetical protein [Spongiactinospora sp. 9N601]